MDGENGPVEGTDVRNRGGDGDKSAMWIPWTAFQRTNVTN
jgi:hypothetical protein